MRAKGSKAPRKQGVLRAKYDFIAAYELGYADVVFGEFNFACQKGDKRGCRQLGLLYVYAPKPKKDTDKAFKIFCQNCDGRHAASYFVPSWFYAGGISATIDAKKSLDMITKSCDIGYGEGCAEPARAYARSQNAQQDVKKEQIFTERACLNGYFKSCLETEKFYKEATDENYKKPIKIFDVPCERGIYESCYVVGAICQNSLKDDKAAKKYYKNAAS